MFRFTPQPVSSASIYWWAGKGGFASRGCTLDVTAPKWWNKSFPPLALYSGGMDFLVLTDPLIDRINEQETDVRLIRAKRQEEAEVSCCGELTVVHELTQHVYSPSQHW